MAAAWACRPASRRISAVRRGQNGREANGSRLREPEQKEVDGRPGRPTVDVKGAKNFQSLPQPLVLAVVLLAPALIMASSSVSFTLRVTWSLLRS